LAEDKAGGWGVGESVKTSREAIRPVLSPRKRTVLAASAGVFAGLYAVLGLVPISALIGISGFITFREAVSPLSGMLLGPAAGGLSIILGVILDFGLGRPVVFFGFDFCVDLAAAVTAGLCFTGRRLMAVLFPAGVIILLELGPSAPTFVSVGTTLVPFVWMHVLSVGLLAGALAAEKAGKVSRLSPIFVVAVTFAATMCGHAAGGILTEVFYLNSGVLFGFASAGAYWSYIFYLYPVERVFLTMVGSALAVPVLRAVDARRKRPTVS